MNMRKIQRQVSGSARGSRWGRLTAASVFVAGCTTATLAWAGEPAGDDPMPVQTERVALVIGSNAPASAEQSPLRYADDDAARMTEVLAQAGVHVELLTSFDPESQARFPRLVDVAHRPTKSEIDAAVARLRARVDAAHERGNHAELVVYYSGHGDVGPDGQGFFALEGGKLTRRDLFGKIVGGSSADHKHLLLDACRSELMVAPRGNGWQPDRSAGAYGKDVAEFLERTQLAGHPDTGVMLAASADQQTHEWARYEGGIFTHQLVSGLRGAADLNGDGRVEYSELGAFVSAANSAVTDPRARLGVFVRAPQIGQRVAILEHRDVATRRTLLFVGDDRRHYSIEDARGVRIADLRRSGPSPTYVRLPDVGAVFITRSAEEGSAEQAREEATVENEARGPIFVARLDFDTSKRQARGALDEAFRDGLFRVPYGQGYYAGYTDQTGMLGVEDPEWEVHVWQRVDGEMVEVAKITGNGEADVKAEAPAEEPPPPEGPPVPVTQKTVVTVEESPGELWRNHWGRYWGGFSFGTELNPFSPDGDIRFQPKRIIANDFVGLQGNPVYRGFDARWWSFSAADPRSYPRGEWYFRTGYTEGRATIGPKDETVGYEPTDATQLDYFTVPLFFGGNLYAVKRFPIRPFAGLGFGFDVLDLKYTRPDGSVRTDTSARIGFELHAGVEIRITNYFAISGEVRQLWSAQRKIPKVPNFSNEGFTIVTAARFNLPLHRRAGDRSKHRRTTTTTIIRESESAPNPPDVAPAASSPSPEAASSPTPEAASSPTPEAASSPDPEAPPAAAPE